MNTPNGLGLALRERKNTFALLLRVLWEGKSDVYLPTGEKFFSTLIFYYPLHLSSL